MKATYGTQQFLNFPFYDGEHEEFFYSALHEICSAWPPIIATIYLLSATEEVRECFWGFIDPDGNIRDDYWAENWSDDARRLIALSVNLQYGDNYDVLAPAHLYDTALHDILRTAVTYWLDCSYAA